MLWNIPAGLVSRRHILDHFGDSINIAFDEGRVFYSIVAFTFSPSDCAYDNHASIPIYFHLQDILPEDVYFLSTYLVWYEVDHPGSKDKMPWVTFLFWR